MLIFLNYLWLFVGITTQDFQMLYISHVQDARLVYKTYATLHVIFIFDGSENELAMLDLMQGNVMPRLLL